MNRLNRHLVYLSGPMDLAPDGGVGWRAWLTPILQKHYGLGVINPCDKPTDYADESVETINKLHKSKEEGDYKTTREIMKPIAGIDLRSVHKSDFIILYIDTDIHMCGSYMEAMIAIQQRKPVLAVCKQSRSKIPNFLYGLPPYEMFFDNFEKMLDYLDHINQDENIEDHRSWHFWDYEKMFGVNNG